jgi:hypothetical protein
MPDLRTLRSTCDERLDGIPVPQPFRVDEFAAALAARRRRRLELRELPAAARGVLTGAWVATRQADIVFVEQAASHWHQDLIFLHEAGHMLCDHQADATFDPDHLAGMLPDISPAAIRRMLGRHGYSSEEEHDAEMMASHILARADTGPSPAITGTEPRLLPRLTEALQHPVRHV